MYRNLYSLLYFNDILNLIKKKFSHRKNTLNTHTHTHINAETVKHKTIYQPHVVLMNE